MESLDDGDESDGEDGDNWVTSVRSVFLIYMPQLWISSRLEPPEQMSRWTQLKTLVRFPNPLAFASHFQVY